MRTGGVLGFEVADATFVVTQNGTDHHHVAVKLSSNPIELATKLARILPIEENAHEHHQRGDRDDRE